MRKKIIVVILFVVLYLTVFDLFVKGSVGLSLETYSCLGIEIASKRLLIQKAPKADFGFKYPFNFLYNVNSENSEDVIYCLGKSVYKIK